MTDPKRPEALRLANGLQAVRRYKAAAELRRQHAEIESLRAKLDELEKQEPVAVKNHHQHMHMVGPDDGGRISIDELSAIPIGARLYVAAGARPVEEVPAPGAGDQVQMILKHRLIRKVEGDWLAASEFMTGEPDPSWLAKTEESPEEWRIEQARRVSGEQIQAGLTRAFASWKKPAPAAVVGPFQDRVQPWLVECFGEMIAGDREERNHRFLEEALELVQSLGCTQGDAHQLVDYVYGRPIGVPAQEAGGVMVTLAALCLANGMDMHSAGEVELARINEPATVKKIRAKQAAKPKRSPLPMITPTTQPAPAAQDDEKDAARLYPVVIDGLLWLCTKRGGTFKPVDDCAAVNPPLSWKNALAADKREPT